MKLVGRVERARIAGGAMVRLHYPPWHVLVTSVGGEPCAIEDACNHAGASLCEGTRHEGRVTCPLHGYVFELKSGKLVAPKGLCPDQRRFVVRVEGEDVVVWDPFDVTLVGA